MSRLAKAFNPAEESVSAAHEAVQEFEAIIAAFFDNRDVAGIIKEINPQSGEEVTKLKVMQPIPKQCRRKAREALTTAKESLDQATFAARNLLIGHRRDSVYFPWAIDPADLEKTMRNRLIPENLRCVFRKYEPYYRAEAHSGGSDVLRNLASIANNKHTVGMSVSAIVVQTDVRVEFTGPILSAGVGSRRYDPVKNEMELGRCAPGTEFNYNYRVHFSVTLDDPRFPKSVGVVEALRGFARMAEDVTKDLRARCEQLLA